MPFWCLFRALSVKPALSMKRCSRLKHLSVADMDLSQIEIERIRNFSIIAHVDHGKSTLADRMLELAGVQIKEARVMDKLKVEKERGITVKAQTASIMYKCQSDGKDYLLNLIDTPGHVDFSSEVSRSLAACQGVILLVDANQGVQAQTVSNFYLAFANDLVVVPVVNKIDLPNANPDMVKDQLLNMFEIEPHDVLLVSAKTGLGVRDIFEAIIKKIPPPNKHGRSSLLRFFIQDSWYDRYRGAVNLVQVIDGTLRLNDNVVSVATGIQYTVRSLGMLTPDEMAVKAIHAGQVGTMTCNMRSVKDAIIGDTFHLKDQPVEALMKVHRPKPMVYAGIYPVDQSDLHKMKSAVEKVCLNDYSVSMSQDTSPALGAGWRLGFLGVLHMEVFTQRLEDEYDASVIVTPPSVPYKLKIRDDSIHKYLDTNLDGNFLIVSNPHFWPAGHDVEAYYEPIVKGTIVAPHEYLTAISTLSTSCRGRQNSAEYIDQHRIRLEFTFPLAEILNKFFDSLKSVTSGYGSFDYEEAGYEQSHLVKVDILVNDDAVSELATITHSSRAREHGKRLVHRLEETIPRQQFAIKVQAAVGKQILARGDIKPLRKDVTAKCYGGDMTRKMKLLRHQAEGKKRLKMIGKVQLNQDVFKKLLT